MVLTKSCHCPMVGGQEGPILCFQAIKIKCNTMRLMDGWTTSLVTVVRSTTLGSNGKKKYYFEKENGVCYLLNNDQLWIFCKLFLQFFLCFICPFLTCAEGGTGKVGHLLWANTRDYSYLVLDGHLILCIRYPPRYREWVVHELYGI